MGFERLNQLEEYIKEQKSATPEELCQKFHISMSTLRRDISLLVQRGAVQKAYGYVSYNFENAGKIIPFDVRNAIHTLEKQAACSAAASLVEDNDTIYVDSGSTTCHLIDYIQDRQNITVITSNLDLILRAAPREHIRLLALPGELNRKNNSFSPVSGVDLLCHLNFSKAFIAASGLTLEDGFSHSYLSERPLKQAVMSKAARHYFILDDSKFGEKSLLHLCPVSRADAICTNRLPEAAYIDYCHEHGIPLLTADS